ncbi:MAG TPA: hypothetical protein PL045_08720, partial [Chitinophagaceae bacterium]|nr:hypothetical protein [Chitinophagaceae bacterium]
VFYGLLSIKKSQVIQESPGSILVKVVTDGGLSKTDAATIQQRISYQLGDMNIAFEEVNEIPLNSNGKYQAVISKIK